MRSKLTKLISSIYDTAADETVWPGVLEQVADFLGSSGACLIVDDASRNSTAVVGAARLDPGGVRSYNAHFHSIDLFMENGRRKRNMGARSILASNDGIEDRILLRSAFYNDFLRKYGLFFNLSGVIAGDRPVTATYCSLHRSRQRGPYERRQLVVLDALMPHLQKACQIQQRLAAAAQVTNILDMLETGIALVTSSAKPVYLNPAAEQMLAQRDGLFLDSRTGLHSTVRSFPAAVLRQAVSDDLWAGTSQEVWRPSGKRPFHVEVAPIRATGRIL